jgi:anti-anti-sigma regulatory factor
MLKITPMAQDATQITLKLEGRLVGQWVNALKRECERYLTKLSNILLDLSGVSFVDAQGLTTLKALRGH